MSTDVYLDFAPAGSPLDALDVGDDIGHRIGHHADLSSGTDLLGALRLLALTPHVAEFVPSTAATFCRLYHAAMMVGYGGADAIPPEDLEALLREHIGQRWRVRVD